MLFNIEYDGGDCIVGYVVPDGYVSEAKLRIHVNGRPVLEIGTPDLRPSLVAAGRHETGRCGFMLDAALLPSIKDSSDLEVFDASTNLLIYRRPQPQQIARKILRLDTHLFPLRKLDLSMRQFFQYCAVRIDQFGRETIEQLFLLNGVRSVFLSGRIMYKNYQNYIDGEFSTFIVIQDPYEELAERLLIMKIISQNKKKILSEREELLFTPAIAFAEDLPISDANALKRAMKNMPKNVAILLSNPVVRQLTTSTLDEMPQRFSVAGALDVLSSCAVVGFRQDPATIGATVGGVLGRDRSCFQMEEQFSSVSQLGAALRGTGTADAFLERDLELYQAALGAAEASGNV